MSKKYKDKNLVKKQPHVDHAINCFFKRRHDSKSNRNVVRVILKSIQIDIAIAKSRRNK